MGHVSEPKNIDLVVGPSILTEETKQNIVRAIARYKKTGVKPDNAGMMTQKPEDNIKSAQHAKSLHEAI